MKTDGGNGGEYGHINIRRLKHAVHGAETSGGIWKVVDVGNVQVGGAPHWERRWGVGVR